MEDCLLSLVILLCVWAVGDVPELWEFDERYELYSQNNVHITCSQCDIQYQNCQTGWRSSRNFKISIVHFSLIILLWKIEKPEVLHIILHQYLWWWYKYYLLFKLFCSKEFAVVNSDQKKKSLTNILWPVINITICFKN